GKEQIFRALEDNVTDLYEGIPLEELPQTFRDAITVCRAMNIGYVWIDSLCIIQDSEQDWAAEARLMGQVYECCIVNIAATGFDDGAKGFFVDRRAEIVRPFKVKSEGNEYVKQGDFHLVWASKWYEEVLSAPLNSRGWVFQERLLSPRVLSFGAREVFWECKAREACESYPLQYPAGPRTLDSHITGQRSIKSRDLLGDLRIPYLTKTDIESGKEGISSNDVWELWAIIVEIYNGTDLTKDKDKLIAISGIMAVFNNYFRSDCLAGIWKLHMPMQLLWSVPRKTIPNCQLIPAIFARVWEHFPPSTDSLRIYFKLLTYHSRQPIRATYTAI
ncbi:HET-domain-containing protein, partial [Cadophora sp. DSE1049]